MPTLIPSFLLKKLYVKGSFKNTSSGFELSLRNTLAAGTLIGITPPSIDGRSVSLDNVLILDGDGPPVHASEISTQSPRTFPLDVVVTFRVEDRPLAPGRHRISLQIDTKEAGALNIDAEDSLE